MDETTLPDRIRLLPPKIQDEISDYVDFLYSKYSNKGAVPEQYDQKPAIARFRGTLNNVDTADLRDESDRII